VSARQRAWNPSREQRARTLLEIFRGTVERWPERLALDAPDATYSYAELDAAVASDLR
jgi:non-ribosomal peptide synthetase component F